MASTCSGAKPIILFLLPFIVTTGPLLFWTTVSVTAVAPKNITTGRIPAVFVMGDSILDTGNNNYIVTMSKFNFPPYGKNFPGKIPTGRPSDGRLISDFVVEILGIKYLLPSYLDPNLGVEDLVTGVCFASAGSGYDRETPKILGALPVPYQLKLFKQYVKKLRTLVGEQRSDDIIKNSLYVISLGNNDVGLTYFLRKKKSDMASYSSFLVSQASATLRQLYGLGVRNIVHLSTIVTGCVPASRTLFGGVRRQCNDESNELAMMYNKKLSNEIERLNNDVRLPNSSIVFVDVYYPLFNMIRYPENYGFAITKKACCGTGTVEFGILCNPLAPTCTNISKYIFWDGVHPTEKTYKIIFSKIGKSVDKLLRKQL